MSSEEQLSGHTATCVPETLAISALTLLVPREVCGCLVYMLSYLGYIHLP